MNKLKKNKGFTLIELMITVAIIGILAAIAYPSYTRQVQKTRRADAKGALMGLSNAMERYFTENNRYTGAATGPADTGTPRIFATQSPVSGGTKYYDLRITAATASAYTIEADPVGTQDSDPCGKLTLSNTGLKTPPTSGCW